MAPPKGGKASAKPSSSKKPGKTVVPAIPLPFVQRKAAAQAAANANGKAKSTPDEEIEVKNTNGGPAPKPEIESPTASTTTVDSANNTSNAQTTASTSPSAAEQQSRTPDEEAITPHVDDDATEKKPEKSNPNDGGDLHVEVPYETNNPPDEGPQAETVEPTEGSGQNTMAQGNVAQEKPAATGSSGFRPLDQYPTFRPQNPPINTNGVLSEGPHPPGHTSYPSNDNIHFGTFHDSTSSSPVPPLSGGGVGVPPYRPLPVPFHGPHPSNGHPRAAPPGFDMMAANSAAPGYAEHFNPHPPARLDHHGTNFPPNFTPDSPSFPQPGHAQNGVAYDHFNGGAPRRSSPNFGNDNASREAQHHIRGNIIYPGAPPNMIPQDDAAGLIEYFRQQFQQEEFADCSLKLEKRDSRAPPFQIPGHRAVFARSPVLHELLRKNARQGNCQTLVVETEDDWIDNGAFYMACQRLYGGPLLQAPRPGADWQDFAGTSTDQINFALSYAASGNLLGWEPVVRRGAQIAIQLLMPDTVEIAMRFAQQRKDSGTHEEFKYGVGSFIILDGILTFLRRSLLPFFQLDSSVADAHGYARLPYDTPSAPVPKTDSPVTVRGNHRGHFSQGSRGNNQPAIQFGDLSLENGQTEEYAATPRASESLVSGLQAILSRLLINLPFVSLQRLVEYNCAPISGLVEKVVAEREARRLRALEALKTGRLPNSDAIRASLSSPAPPPPTPWTILGWEETLTASGRGRGVSRQWNPLREAQPNAVSDYP